MTDTSERSIHLEGDPHTHPSASRLFSISSFATLTGRWTTSPAAMRSTTSLGRGRIFLGRRIGGGCCVAIAQGTLVAAAWWSALPAIKIFHFFHFRHFPIWWGVPVEPSCEKQTHKIAYVVVPTYVPFFRYHQLAASATMIAAHSKNTSCSHDR